MKDFLDELDMEVRDITSKAPARKDGAIEEKKQKIVVEKKSPPQNSHKQTGKQQHSGQKTEKNHKNT